jgi:hypothetical protein
MKSFKWVLFGMLLAVVMVPAYLFSKVGTEMSTILDGKNKIYEIAETLTVLDGIAGGTTYTIQIPRGVAMVKLTTSLSGDYAPGGADAYYAITPIFHYGDATEAADYVDSYDELQNLSTYSGSAVYVCDDSVSGGGTEAIIKQYLLGTYGSAVVQCDSIRILVRASTGAGDWRAGSGTDLWKIWIEVVPISPEAIAGIPYTP